MGLLEKLREDYKDWKVDPERPVNMLTTAPEEETEAPPPAAVVETPKPETPEETMKKFDETPPPAEAKPPEQQAADSFLLEAKQMGLRPTGAGLGAAEAPTRAAVKIPRYPTSKKQIDELDRKAQLARRGLTAEQSEFYDSQLDNIRTQAEDLFSRLEKTRLEEVEQKDRIDLIMGIAQGLEHIGHGFTRLFAANYGLKKGVDMSGIKFDKYDWATAQARFDKRFDRIISSIDSKMEKVITSQTEQSEAVLKQKAKQEEELLKDARGFEEQATSLRAADIKGEQARLLAQARLDDAALDRASRERMKAAELASKAMLQSVSMKQKAARSAAEKAAADTDAKLAVYDYIKAQLPQEGDVDPDDLSYIIKTVRTSAAKAGVDLAPLAEINEENRKWWIFGNSSEAVRNAIDEETKKLLGLSKGAQEETGTVDTAAGAEEEDYVQDIDSLPTFPADGAL